MGNGDNALGETYYLTVHENESVLDALIRADASLSAVCGGTGKCGKCRVRLLEGELRVTESDRQHFTASELESGLRLACRAYPEGAVKVEVLYGGEDGFEVVAEHAMSETVPAREQSGSYGIAVDIGTTTIAMQLIVLTTGKIIGTYTALNRQRRFGTDVISRMKASVEGHKEELRRSIREDLGKGIRSLTRDAGICADAVKELAIAGNTTMIHLLMGYPCECLGAYPFTPVNIGLIESTYESILGDAFLRARVRIFPGISVFVGGDTVSGLYERNADLSEEYFLFIDLGTNGEMAIGNKERILTTSAAAGPAFEGGNIRFGTGSVKGAIASVTIGDCGAEVETIAGIAPIGICGTGVIEAAAELLRTGLMDETGCLEEAYFEDGYPLAAAEDGSMILITQKDIREIQLAKAAVRAGLEILFLRYGITKEEVAKVYLAGGFGFHLNCHKAASIGLLPEELEDKVEIIGNSALSGAVKFLLDPEAFDRTTEIVKCAEEVVLSLDQDFNRLYIDYMGFYK